MARTVKQAKIETPTPRSRLKKGRQAHWVTIVPGPRPAHLGWQCFPGERTGKWVLREYTGKYSVQTLGRADDVAEADGITILSYEQALAKARAMIDAPAAIVTLNRMTVAEAMDRYIRFKETQGAPVRDLKSRSSAHIVPPLGDLLVTKLTAEKLRDWLAALAASPKQTRPKLGVAQYKEEPVSDEAIRRRRSSANRILTYLKASLNHCYDEGHVPNRDAWSRKLKPFRAVEAARVHCLTVEEVRRLVNGADPDFRPLLRGALESGARYSELTRLVVSDFNPDSGTLFVRKSKTNLPRYIVLTAEGADFFRSLTLGRSGSELLFRHTNGNPWKASEQSRPMAEANRRAKLDPPLTFHGCRHVWASLAVMDAVPLMVVAKNLGHTDTRMVEKHYGHLAPNFFSNAIRAGAPKFGFAAEKTVVPIKR